MVKFSGARKSDVVLDPFCKDGVIAIEAAQEGIKRVHAYDDNKNNIRNALINAKVAKVKIDCKTLELDWLDTIFKERSVDYILTNVFISQRNKDADRQVTELVHQAEFLLGKGMTIITNKPEVIKEKIKEKFVIEKEKNIQKGDMKYTLLNLTKKNHP